MHLFRYENGAGRPAARFLRVPSLLLVFVVVAALSGPRAALAQASPSLSGNAPAPTPAGTDVAAPPPLPRTLQAEPDVSPKARKDAEDAYLRGARALDHKDLAAAESEFQHATQLNPRNRDYAIALAVTREHRLTDLVQRAARAQKLGRTDEADKLLLDARAIDPNNAIVRQHFQPDGSLTLSAGDQPSINPFQAAREKDASSLGGPVTLTPDRATHDFHIRGSAPEILRDVCTAFGLKAELDSSVAGGPLIRFDLDGANFAQASRTAETVTHSFFIPLQPKVVFFAKDTADNRAKFEPTEEETIFMPGASSEAMSEYANVARNVFNLKSVTAVGPAGGLVLRGDPAMLQRVNATLDDLVDGGSDVLLDVTLYEYDYSLTRTLGVAPPGSIGVFPVASEAQNLINANQSLISAAIASNQLVLTSNPYTNAIEELGLLLASGVVSSSQFSNLLGVIGHYGGLPLAGLFLGSSTTFNALLNSSDVRIVDHVQLRAHQGEDASFRAGSRYPIETGIYSSSGASSSLTAAAAGLSINGTSVSSLLSQYLGSTSVSVPQIQYEDLGLTLKATPQVLRSQDVSLKLDLKIEALGSGTINGLPILNSRQLTSQVSMQAGQTALLASVVDTNEQRSIDGVPFLSELPGFQGTEKSKVVNNTELLITITPHVVRNRRMEVASRRVLLPWTSDQHRGGGNEEFNEAPPSPERRGPVAPVYQPQTEPRPERPVSEPPPEAPAGEPQRQIQPQ